MPLSDTTMTAFGPTRSSYRPAVSAPIADTTLAATPKINTSAELMP